MKFFVNEVNHVVVIGWWRVHMLRSSFYSIFSSLTIFQASQKNSKKQYDFGLSSTPWCDRTCEPPPGEQKSHDKVDDLELT